MYQTFSLALPSKKCGAHERSIRKRWTKLMTMARMLNGRMIFAMAKMSYMKLNGIEKWYETRIYSICTICICDNRISLVLLYYAARILHRVLWLQWHCVHSARAFYGALVLYLNHFCESHYSDCRICRSLAFYWRRNLLPTSLHSTCIFHHEYSYTLHTHTHA